MWTAVIQWTPKISARGGSFFLGREELLPAGRNNPNPASDFIDDPTKLRASLLQRTIEWSVLHETAMGCFHTAEQQQQQQQQSFQDDVVVVVDCKWKRSVVDNYLTIKRQQRNHYLFQRSSSERETEYLCTPKKQGNK